MRIAIDIDSTLHNYWDQFSQIAKRRFGVTLPYEQQLTWTVGHLRPEQLRAIVAETHRDEHVLAAEPYPHAVETVTAWHEAGHFIHITSHRQTAAHDATTAWLQRIGMPFDELYCSFDKISRCTEIGIDVLIDDSPVNLSQALQCGIVGATLLHPWNRDLCDEEDTIVCAEDWPGLRTALTPVLTGEQAA